MKQNICKYDNIKNTITMKTMYMKYPNIHHHQQACEATLMYLIRNNVIKTCNIVKKILCCVKNMIIVENQFASDV